jgi:DNA-binding MarR family transcriptional regulator
MATKVIPDNLALRVWFVTHRTRDALNKCEDRVFAKYGLTSEQYSVLATMKSLEEPVRITDVARWLERSTNSVSMIIDRMVKAGLVKRIRDRNDRRAVRLVITAKSEAALKPATLAALEFIQEVTSPLSREDKRTFVDLHEMVKAKAFQRLSPGINVEEMKNSDITTRPALMNRLCEYLGIPTAKAKPAGGKKRKATR